MLTVQEYLNQNFQISNQQIFFEGNKVREKLIGNNLIIDGYQELQCLYLSDLPNLTKLTLKNCPKLESLELYLDNQLEIEILENVFLKNIKTTNTVQKSIIISQDKPKGFCWNCFGHALSLISLVILATYTTHLVITVNKFKKKLASVE